MCHPKSTKHETFPENQDLRLAINTLNITAQTNQQSNFIPGNGKFCGRQRCCGSSAHVGVRMFDFVCVLAFKAPFSASPQIMICEQFSLHPISNKRRLRHANYQNESNDSLVRAYLITIRTVLDLHQIGFDTFG